MSYHTSTYHRSTVGIVKKCEYKTWIHLDVYKKLCLIRRLQTIILVAMSQSVSCGESVPLSQALFDLTFKHFFMILLHFYFCYSACLSCCLLPFLHPTSPFLSWMYLQLGVFVLIIGILCPAPLSSSDHLQTVIWMKYKHPKQAEHVSGWKIVDDIELLWKVCLLVLFTHC